MWLGEAVSLRTNPRCYDDVRGSPEEHSQRLPTNSVSCADAQAEPIIRAQNYGPTQNYGPVTAESSRS